MPTTHESNPISWFQRWFDQALQTEQLEPTAMCLATVDPQGRPAARIVLLKSFDDKGFVFYTNLESTKGRHLLDHPFAALTFHWKSLERQVRITGPVELVSAAEADEYFHSRSRGSQLGAWASKQSRPLGSRDKLSRAVQALEEKYEGQEVPRPPHWSGFRVRAEQIEFWEAGEFRLHDRFLFTKNDQGWSCERLYP